jgi:L,D-peptidoglycan transpeptidase YkuD (ErfK/YbiS/YcfS/YnhG family)
MLRRLIAVAMLAGVALAGPAAAAVPPYVPSQLTHLGDARQVVVVAGSSRSSSYAILRTYQRGGDGVWRAGLPAMAARVGYAGWQWAAQRRQDTGTTPIGTFRITDAFGLKADPGTRVSYRKVDGNDYWVGDQRDPRTYNLFQPSASAGRTWRIAQAERLAAYPKQYEYAAVIDFNRPVKSSVRWDAKRGEYVSSKPAVAGRGSAIFLHINGTGSTAGCVSVTRANMIKVLRWLDPAAKPRIVMAPTADLRAA